MVLIFFDAKRAQGLISEIEKATDIELDAEGVLGYEAIKILAQIKSRTSIADELRSLESSPSDLGTIYRNGQNFVVPVAINPLLDSPQ